MKLVRNSKGAMFGLDARLAMAIFSLLTVIMGYHYFFNTHKTKARALVKRLNVYAEAVDSIQEDLDSDFFAALNLPIVFEAMKAFWVDGPLKNSALKSRWLGPYVDGRIQTVSIGADTIFGSFVSIMKQPNGTNINNSKLCDNSDSCYYWVRYSAPGVPEKVAEIINDMMDGAGEVNPDINGRVQWNSGGLPAGWTSFWFRLGRALDNNNGSVGQ